MFATKGKRLFVLLLAFVMFAEVLAPSVPVEAKIRRWGVFLGAKVRNVKKVKPYNYIVIDAQHYTKEEIKALKKGGRKVYSYLSVGTLEKYRPYYKRFKKYCLKKYNNWNDENWVNVSKKPWQRFICNELVPEIMAKGINGLWVDNTDVFYEYPKGKIYYALVYMLKRFRKQNIPVFINGGDVFVSKLMEKNQHNLIYGIMQEEVLTCIADYNRGVFTRQGKEDYEYYTAYIKEARAHRISIALLEYTKKPAMRREIIRYCKKHKYSYYICNNVHLK